MIGNIDFVQKVLHVVPAERPRHSPLLIWQLAEELGFHVNGQLPETGASDGLDAEPEPPRLGELLATRLHRRTMA